MILDDLQAKAVAWAYTSLKVVYGPNRPVHVNAHLEELEGLLQDWMAP